jgi:hypothetical protein
VPRASCSLLLSALLCVAAAASGCGAEEPPRQDRVADPGGDGLLVSYEAGNHLQRYGGRVFADGRYELFTASGQERPKWTPYEPFTPDQVQEIRSAVDEALDAGLPSRVTADPPPLDAPTARFTLGDREIVVADWPAKAPPELERLLERIGELRRRPPVPSTWELWTGKELVAREARCEVGEVARLEALRNAIFLPNPPSSSGTGSTPDPPAGTPLVRVTFATPKGDEVLEVHPDGRRVDRTPAQGEQVQSLEADRMAAIRHALAAEDWAALPARLC